VVVSLVGPAVNIALALSMAVVFRFLIPFGDKVADPDWVEFIYLAGLINVILAAFNLIPLPPLDGSVVVERLLPRDMLLGYYRIRPFTMFLPLLLVVFFPGALAHLFSTVSGWWGSFLGIN